jgi:hypothetical protein
MLLELDYRYAFFQILTLASLKISIHLIYAITTPAVLRKFLNNLIINKPTMEVLHLGIEKKFRIG